MRWIIIRFPKRTDEPISDCHLKSLLLKDNVLIVLELPAIGMGTIPNQSVQMMKNLLLIMMKKMMKVMKILLLIMSKFFIFKDFYLSIYYSKKLFFFDH